ncbi:MAG: alginate lyase family protein, partial [Prevotellaceae bacterium]|nr:alginate lyase family protein [Prevotellaceae bacterium]
MRRLFLLLLAFAMTISLQAKEHPCLLHTRKGVAEMKSSQGEVPLFDCSFKELKELADGAIGTPIVVPIPKDAGGGYTHEQHKNNYLSMWNAGVAYQVTGKKEYAAYVHKMLMEYAKMYPTLGCHPDKKSGTTGKIFWQTLNDCVWLVHTSVAYDCVYDYIGEADRKVLEKDLFMPMAEFISNGNKPNLDVFNKMHNHGTWATAAVGMIGYVMDSKDLTEKALRGFSKDGKGGFLLQLEELFSPDGYYTEGPYYLRYAIWPFLMFAQSIQNNEPDVKVFERNDAILIKAANAEFQMMYNNIVLPLNDALYKDIHTNELVYAVDIAYANAPKESRELLSIAKEQDRVIICDAGFKTAKAAADSQAQPFIGKPMLFRDGREGDQGAISILRYGQNPDQTCLVMKATSHGLSHGHYDKLSFSFYDNGATILQDYGAVRFLNIEPKYGGHYTVENNTFGKQTIGHNTLVVDQTSHFRGDIKESGKCWPEQLFFDVQPNIQITSAREVNA